MDCLFHFPERLGCLVEAWRCWLLQIRMGVPVLALRFGDSLLVGGECCSQRFFWFERCLAEAQVVPVGVAFRYLEYFMRRVLVVSWCFSCSPLFPEQVAFVELAAECAVGAVDEDASGKRCGDRAAPDELVWPAFLVLALVAWYLKAEALLHVGFRAVGGMIEEWSLFWV